MASCQTCGEIHDAERCPVCGDRVTEQRPDSTLKLSTMFLVYAIGAAYLLFSTVLTILKS